MQYKINDALPGWSSTRKLSKLAQLASEVPDDGWIVEVGSFCGRSAFAMGMNKKESVKLTCFDKFPDAAEHIPDSSLGDKKSYYCFSKFVENTSEVKNLETVRAFMPLSIEFLFFTKQVDLIFIDCIHTYEAVKADIETWYKFMKPGGIMVFDDYFDMFPGCIQAVDEFIAQVKPTKSEYSECAMFVYL